MILKLRKNRIFLLLGFLFLSFFIAQGVKASVDDNVSGWAWSENVGWISFNSTTGGGGIDYGVHVSSTGMFSGYAWSENVGWISFNEADLSGCPVSPCEANLDSETDEVSGWAKVLSIPDGWIKLRDGTTYGVWLDTSTSPAEFKDWAWSDTIGWISFNSVTGGGSVPYAVIIDIDTVDPVVEAFDIDPVYPNWVSSTVPFDISWTVSDSGGSHLSHVEIWKASYDEIDCSTGREGACSWVQVNDDYNAPTESDLWINSVLDSPRDDGVWWYGIHVLDNNSNLADEDGPIKVGVDDTMPNSQIQLPNSNTWHSDNFSIDTLDEDNPLVSGLRQCQYKVYSYDYYSPGCNPYCEYSTIWENRTCNTSAHTITVGGGGVCAYEGSQSCWVYIRSQDNAGNWHSYSQENGSVKYYNIDWTEPAPNPLYITETDPDPNYPDPIQIEEGVKYNFKAHVTDNEKVVACDLYINNTRQKAMQLYPAGCSTDCTASTTFTFIGSGTFYNNFVNCDDAADNVEKSASVTIEVAQGTTPVVTSLDYFTSHSSTPSQECASQINCCMEPTTQDNCSVKFNISAYDPDENPLSYDWDFGDTGSSSLEDPDHHYTDPDSYNVTVDVFDGSEHAYDNVGVVVSDPTVSVSLTADPAFGIDSLSGVDLSAIVSGSMFGTVSYRFDCTNNGDWEVEALHQSVETFTAVDACDYAAPGLYTAKVSIDRGSGGDEDTIDINVVESDCSPGQQTVCTSSQGCSHTITCQANGTWPSCPTDECVKTSTRSCENCGEQVCLSTCQWGVCEGGGGCTVGPDCPECSCPPDVCIGQDYYDYPSYGDCNVNCTCEVGTGSGDACEPTITTDAPQCNAAPVCDSLGAVPDHGAAPVEISFTGSAHDTDGAVTNYGFIFGDGSSSTTTLNTVDYIYNTPGTYCAKLKVKDNDGSWSALPGDCPDVCAKQINISENNPPVASVACDASGCTPGGACNGTWAAYNRNCNFYFLNESTDPNSTNPPDNNNDIIKSTWSIFYQGGTPWQDPYVVCNDNSETPDENEAICDVLMPLLPASQNYYVTLTAEDSVGATDDQSKNFYVKREIAADFQCSAAEGGWQSCDGFVVSEDESVQFQDITTVSEGASGIVSWNWTFEDGTPATSNEQNPSASFVNVDGNSGTVRLEVTDDAGRTDSQTYQLQITIPLPEWYEVSPF